MDKFINTNKRPSLTLNEFIINQSIIREPIVRTFVLTPTRTNIQYAR